MVEIVSLVAHRREDHVRVSLWPNFARNGRTCECALQQTVADLPAMSQRRRGFVEVRIRRHWLRVEVVETGIPQIVRSKMEASGQGLLGRQNGVQLGERIEGGRPGQILRIR